MSKQKFDYGYFYDYVKEKLRIDPPGEYYIQCLLKVKEFCEQLTCVKNNNNIFTYRELFSICNKFNIFYSINYKEKIIFVQSGDKNFFLKSRAYIKLLENKINYSVKILSKKDFESENKKQICETSIIDFIVPVVINDLIKIGFLIYSFKGDKTKMRIKDIGF